MLHDRYEPQSLMGHGLTTVVYRGIDRQTNRVVVIKVLNDVYSADPKCVKRFQIEAQAATVLHHPHIADVYDYGQSESKHFMVMEFVEGTSLRRYLHSRGVLDINRAIRIAHDVALGLGAIHRCNIVHRNVQPRTILLGHEDVVKLAGVSIATTDLTLDMVRYYAPEQAQGEIVTPASDVYSLGIVMYEMLTGRTLFDRETSMAMKMQHLSGIPVPLHHLNPGIPPDLEEVILQCLESVPGKRFSDGSELAETLKGFQK